jgi:hypothetical protein
MIDSTSQIVWGIIFGSIGFGFFLYGRKQRAVVPLLVGLALMVIPYFIPNIIALVLVGSGLVALPYFLKI